VRRRSRLRRLRPAPAERPLELGPAAAKQAAAFDVAMQFQAAPEHAAGSLGATSLSGARKRYGECAGSSAVS